jgi:RNA polymerase sigma-70 factor (ECF subfamily)
VAQIDPIRPGNDEENGMATLDDEFEWFYRAEYPMVARTVFFVVHDRARAEDIAQEAFVRLLERWRRVARYERPDAWVRRVAIRLAIRSTQRDRLRPVLEQRLEPSSDAGPIDLDLLRAVGQLPVRHRAAIVLFYFEDRPIAEIVHILGCSESAVKVWLHRARKSLAVALQEEEAADDAT